MVQIRGGTPPPVPPASLRETRQTHKSHPRSWYCWQRRECVQTWPKIVPYMWKNTVYLFVLDHCEKQQLKYYGRTGIMWIVYIKLVRLDINKETWYLIPVLETLSLFSLCGWWIQQLNSCKWIFVSLCRGMCHWRTWTHALWKCSCAAYWRGKATVKVFVGYHSTLTDIWRERELYPWTDPIHSFLTNFSIRTWKVLQPHTGSDQETPISSDPTSHWWHKNSFPFVLEITFCTLVQVVTSSCHCFPWKPWLSVTVGLQNSAHSTPVAGKENMSHHCGQLT